VQRGVHYLLNSLTAQAIGPQPYGDPDGNQNGIALFAPTGHPIYETGPLMDAFVACVRPELIAPVGPANVRGRAFRDVMQDLVDIYTWGQYDDPTVGGGWRYGWNQHPDNSAAQWGAIGLLAAEHYWGSIVPAWTKERNIVWVNYSKGSTGFGYTGPGDGEATTPSAMVQLAWAGVARTNALWQHGETYLARNWNTLLNNYNLYGHYAIAKALRTAVPEPVQNLTWQGATWDWFLDPQRGLGRFTVDRQRADGSWTSRDSWVNNPPLATAYSVIILSSSLFQRGPVAVIQFRPNPSAVGFPVVFDARASYHQHPAYQVVEYRWDFNAADGLDFSRPDAVGPVVTNTYPALGTNVVTLQVRDNNVPVLTDIASVEVRTTIPPFPPTADAGGPYVLAVGEDLALDGSGSFDVDAAAGDYISAWDWEVDFEMPLDFDDGVTGEKAVLAGGFATAGQHRIGLRVSDATAIVFPELGLTNLTADDFSSALVYERVVTNLSVRPKESKIQLTWTKAGDYAVVLRSTVGPQRGFVEIGRTESDYATFLDTNVVMGVEYFYRLLVYSFSRPDPLGISDARLTVSRPRDADNRPPAFLATPLRVAQVGQLYEVTLEASDPDNDPLTFTLLEGPTNLTIYPATGLLRFTPTADQLGSQTLSVEVRAEGGRDILTYSLVVFPANNAAPTATANGPYVALLGEPIQFSSAGTGDPDGQALRLVWNFGDGNSSTNADPVHLYTAAGNYLVSLFVNDGYGGTASARANVSVLRPNRAPTATVTGGPAFAIRLGETLTLDGAGSFDLDGDNLLFTWNWGDGQSDAEAPAQASHTYAAQGTYSGQLRVADGRGGVGTAGFTVTVGPANRPPVVLATVSDPSPFALTEITFDATATTDPDGDTLTFDWDFGDRTRTTGPLVTHVFREVLDYVVTLKVRDQRGGETWETFAITARNSPATISSQPPLLVRSGQPYSYLPTVSDLNGDALSHELAQGPATMSVNPDTGAIDWLPGDADVGPNPVVLRVTDARGAVSEQSWTLVVTTPLGPEIDLEPLAIVMTNVTVDPQSLELGGTVRVEFRNNGADEVPVPFPVTVFVDADNDGAWSTNTDWVVASGTVPAGLQQGFVGWIEMGVRGLALFAGAPLSTFLDSENVVPEYDEANNLRRAGFNSNTNVPPVVDLTASRLQVDRTGLPDRVGLTARLGNAGLVPVAAGAPLAFYNGDPLAGGALLGVARTADPLPVGAFADLSIEWLTPPVAVHTLTVVADDQGDGTGFYAEISEANNRFRAAIDLTTNEPPIADVGPDQTVAIGDYAVFNGRASRDPEGKTLTYRWRILSIPLGSRATLNAADTEQAWLQPDVTGEYVVQLVVNDGVNDSEPATVRVLADDPSANQPPAITSTPAFEGMTTVLYEYALQANDPDGDPLKYRLGQAPAGMTIDPDTGLIRWTPTTPGSAFVQAIVEDNRGAGRYQSWSVTVREYQNLPPRITSSAPLTASPGAPYAYLVLANDPNRDPITFALPQAPAGMTINPAGGQIAWTPTAAQFGSHAVTVTASDGKGGVATQRFDVVVFDAATDGPVVRAIPDQTVVAPAGFAAIPLDSFVFDPNDPKEALTWRVTGTSQLAATIDANRVATVSYPAGTLVSERLTFLATDPAGKSSFAAATFTVRGRDNPPVAALANLSDAETTRIETGFFELKGTADDPDTIDPVAYRVTLHDENGAQVADVTPKPVNLAGWREGRVPAGGSLGTLDLTLVRNGTYTLNLTVRGGNTTASANRLIAVDSGLKIGQFTFSQQDATVPVGGAVLRLVRTYDSLNTKSADFGYSWAYSVSDLGLEINEQRVREQDLFGDFFSLRVGGGRDVSLDMPDTGRRVTFTYSLVPGGMFRLRAVWTAPAGVNATLVPTVSPNMIKLFSLPAYWEAAGINVDVENFDFPGFVLTLQDGTQYRIEREDLGEHFIAGTGAGLGNFVHAYGKAFIRQVVEPTKERTEFVREGTSLKSVEQFDAQNQKLRSLVFRRDAQKRITALFTPNHLDASGNPTGPATVTYEYDARGNLARVNRLTDDADPANPVFQTTTFVYALARFPHFLTEIRGPSGQPLLRVEFDSDGRMIGTVDAQGNRSSVQRNIAGRSETIFDRLGNPTTHTYDDRGNIVATTDPLGRTTLRTFDSRGRQTSETDPLGRKTTLTFGDHDQPLTVTDHRGRVTRYTYDQAGRLLTATDAYGRSVGHEYDAAGNLVATIDADGRKTTLQYDTQSRLLAMLDPAGRTVASFGYNDRGSMAAITNGLTGTDLSFQEDRDGNLLTSGFTWRNPNDTNDIRLMRTRLEYDAAGRLARRTDFAGNSARMTYNSFGQIATTTDSAGRELRQRYDSRGNLIETRYADDTVIRMLYDEEGREVLSTERAPDGQPANAIQTTYDAAGRPIRQDSFRGVLVTVVSDPSGDRTVLTHSGEWVSALTFEYDAADRVVRMVRPDRGEIRTAYNDDDQPVARTDALGNRVEYAYDAKGNLVITRDALGHETYYTYDPAGRLTAMIYPDGAASRWSYDEEGRLVAETAPSGHERRFEHADVQKLAAVELPAVADPASPGAVVRPRYDFEYDPQGNLLRQRDALGRVTRFEYDALNRPTARQLPRGQREATRYDNEGRPVERTDFMGQKTVVAYDALGRPTNKTSFARGSSEPRQRVGRTYDAWGRPETVSDQRGETRFHYDAAGRLTSVATPEATSHYEYDPASGHRMRAFTDQTETRYTYDELGRLATATLVKRNGEFLPAPETVAYEYTPNGSRAAMTLPNGTRTRYQYDSRDRLTLLTHATATGELLASYAYHLSPDNLRTAVTEVVRSPAGDYRTNHLQYTYDPLSRLVAEKATDAGDQSGYEARYTYDLVGNRLERQVTVAGRTLITRYFYDDNDRLLMETNSLVLRLTQSGRHAVRLLDANGRSQIHLRPLPSAAGYFAWSALPYFLAMGFLVPVCWIPWAARRRLRILALDLNPHRALLSRCVSGLLAAVMVVVSLDLRLLADEAARYQALQTAIWGLDGSATTYEYDENGSVVRRVVTGPTDEVSTYRYDLENRLVESVTVTTSSGVQTTETKAFTYNSAGTLVGTQTKLGSNEGTTVFEETRVFVVDSGVTDGLSHILEERSSLQGPAVRTYFLGDDPLAEIGSGQSAMPRYYLADGHGSTRQVINAAGLITDSYAYDAYGLLLGDRPAASQPSSAALLFAGQRFDAHLQQYHLRARFYDPSNGRFTQLDPFHGVQADPQSLHKYVYAHADPVNRVDPTGLFGSLSEAMTSLAIQAVLFTIFSWVLAPIFRWLGAKFLPDWAKKLLEEGTPSAFLVGAGVAAVYKVGSLNAAVELLISPHTWRGAAFLVVGGGVALAGKGKGGGYATYAGMVLNAASSGQYAGSGISISMDWNSLSANARQKTVQSLGKMSWTKLIQAAGLQKGAARDQLFTAYQAIKKGGDVDANGIWKLLTSISTIPGLAKPTPTIGIGFAGTLAFSANFWGGGVSTRFSLTYGYGFQFWPYAGGDPELIAKQEGHWWIGNIWYGNVPDVPFEKPGAHGFF
jgi:RHS repeat-associated protein